VENQNVEIPIVVNDVADLGECLHVEKYLDGAFKYRCIKCKTDYYLKDNRCFNPLLRDCLVWDNNGTCTKCRNSY